MNMRRLRFILLFFFCVVLVLLHVHSSLWFRMKLADYHRDRHEYGKSIYLYNRILAKDNAKKYLNKEAVSKLNLALGNLYAKSNFENLAIESYAKVDTEILTLYLQDSYDKDSRQNNLLIAIGMLESARFDAAIKSLGFLKVHYPDFADAKKYISVASDLKERPIALRAKELYFLIGNAYISNKLFKQARSFFTKRILDYGKSPVDVLSYVSRNYYDKDKIKQEIWGDNIYVVLEDFEGPVYRLSRLMSNARSKISSHAIARDPMSKENHLEILDIEYIGEGYDFWSKNTKFLLDDTGLNIGIRVSIKSSNPSGVHLYFKVIYPKQEITGVCMPPTLRRDNADGWVEHSIKDLCTYVEKAASIGGWAVEDEVILDKIIIDTRGASNRFLIDNIELFVI